MSYRALLSACLVWCCTGPKTDNAQERVERPATGAAVQFIYMPAPRYASAATRVIVDYDDGNGSQRLTSQAFLAQGTDWTIKRPTRESGRLTIQVHALDTRGDTIAAASMTKVLEPGVRWDIAIMLAPPLPLQANGPCTVPGPYVASPIRGERARDTDSLFLISGRGSTDGRNHVLC